VKDLEWLIEQTENRLRQNQNLLESAKGMVEALEKSEQEMKNLKSKNQMYQIDLDRIAEKNQKWASETVDRIVSGQQDYPRAKTWKLYQAGLLNPDHLSDLNRESDRQVAEKSRWVDPPVQGTSQ
jgi:hypothetical protein